MEIRLLPEDYRNAEWLFSEFSKDQLWQSGHISEDFCVIPESIPDFPIYFAKMKDEEKVQGFLKLIEIIEKYFLPLERDIYMNARFWHSYLCLYKRDYLIKTYPQIEESKSIFENIVLKKFDWENYIYKAILAAQYVTDGIGTDDLETKNRYYQMIINNMDLFNYIIKKEIFRNGNFLIHILDIVEENGWSRILKAKIKDRPELGKDQRYGRRVLFEFNKSYPIVLAPMLSKDQLEKYFKKYLSYYYHEGNNGEGVVSNNDNDGTESINLDSTWED